MKKESADFLWGISFSSLSQRRRKLLTSMIVVSLLVHVVALGIFGSWVVMRSKREEKTVFVTPPPIKTYEPRKLEHRVKVQKRQRSSSRPSMVPRMVSMKMTNLALPQIKTDPKIITTSFQPKFKPVSGKGLGVGLGTGYGLGGFGQGVSKFDFFGIRGRGDRIAILVDVSVSMVEEERGGPSGFNRVKARINDVVTALNEAAFFNLVVFADAASTWQGKMVIANDENKDGAKRFLRPFNVDGNWGLTDGNLYAKNLGLEAIGGTTRLDLAITAAFEQGADTILIISDGLPKVEKPIPEGKLKSYNRKLEEWRKKNSNKLKDYEDSATVEKKVWVAGDDGKLREGKRNTGKKGRWEVRRVRTGHRPKPPDEPDRQYWTLNEFINHMAKLNESLYAKKGKKLPIIHSIGYQIDREGGNFLKKLAHKYKGNYRRVASIR
ncbi:MAG: VWA domain-containing protein [Lentisphaerae bacterium]|jgi:hypothetical protein|nr:VWA domain-containing protein [Lentisphaerota bacterium]MBT4818046.1 VWA domain-containing protein [Lentisphaerota bacterium]MBT5605016.1 VWA domain-containing protein [Lentisphaerota bacterium]MBT7054646.1 VWA domain-containing protein [Lentisphaerota bacterium]MBT7844675.1 VWA domain-containing protein [Lentisphaerota bacterium]